MGQMREQMQDRETHGLIQKGLADAAVARYNDLLPDELPIGEVWNLLPPQRQSALGEVWDQVRRLASVASIASCLCFGDAVYVLVLLYLVRFHRSAMWFTDIALVYGIGIGVLLYCHGSTALASECDICMTYRCWRMASQKFQRLQTRQASFMAATVTSQQRQQRQRVATPPRMRPTTPPRQEESSSSSSYEQGQLYEHGQQLRRLGWK
jgi:hypothetical protein